MDAGNEHRDLTRIWLFSSCTAKELRTVTKLITEVTVPPRTSLAMEGEPAILFFIILTGQATVQHKDRRTATLGPGNYFGELSLLDEKPRPMSVTSDTEMALLVLRQNHFRKLVYASPRLTRKLLDSMAGRLRAAEALLHV